MTTAKTKGSLNVDGTFNLQCLKCDEWFKSLDKIINRICFACNQNNQKMARRGLDNTRLGMINKKDVEIQE